MAHCLIQRLELQVAHRVATLIEALENEPLHPLDNALSR
jgi:hypothetical protein